jgi:hypothetical protein
MALRWRCEDCQTDKNHCGNGRELKIRSPARIAPAGLLYVRAPLVRGLNARGRLEEISSWRCEDCHTGKSRCAGGLFVEAENERGPKSKT